MGVPGTARVLLGSKLPTFLLAGDAQSASLDPAGWFQAQELPSRKPQHGAWHRVGTQKCVWADDYRQQAHLPGR